VSDELRLALRQLSGQQAAGVLRIVQAELEGRSLGSLFQGPARICSESTYYRRRGWRDKTAFNEALGLARRDYRSWLLDHGAGEALVVLAEGAPLAARALRRQVAGDEGAVAVLIDALGSEEEGLRRLAAENLGRSGARSAVPALAEALAREGDAGVRATMLQAIGDLAAWRDGDEREAAGEILDRVDVKTGRKTEQRVEGGIGAVIGLGLGELDDAELEQLLENLAAAEGGGAAGEAAEGAERDASPQPPLYKSRGGSGPADVDDGAAGDAGAGAAV